MTDPRRRWTLVWLAVAIMALVLLAGGLSRMPLAPGEALPIGAFLATFAPSGSASPGPAFLTAIRIILVLFFWIVTPIIIIALVVSREFRRWFIRRIPAYLVFALILYVLLRFLREMMLANRGQPIDAAPAVGEQPPPIASPGFPSVPEFVNQPPQWLMLLITLVIVAVIAGLIWLLWPRKRDRHAITALDLLTDEAQSTLDDLRAGADVRDTVLRCYAEMSRVLREARGVRRGEGVTAREFEQQLRGAGMGDEHIQRLTRLFERVRYGGRASSERDAREAEDCLFALVQSYGKVFS